MNKFETQTAYESAKAKLNPEQRRAVETIEGPVMVLAGPGTGKTQVLAFRIAEILNRTDSSPRNILALTFTESGVTAMRERLTSLIGVAAYGVGIYTFHSFANRIINDAGAEFYKNHSLDAIDDITQVKLIIQLIDSLNDERLRPMRAPYFYVKPIIHAIKNLKNEGVTPDSLKKLCLDSIDTIHADPDSISKQGKSKGELKQSAKDKIKQLERSVALAELYALYEEELVKRGLYDYEDMILFVIKSFRENPDLKAKYQEQFHYILVDEYQDTNNAQNTLIRFLGDYFTNPNIFVVGDDNQSIYRFQGASVANLLNFLEWFPEAECITLRQNYRSGQVILDNSFDLISHNQARLSAVLPNIEAKLTGQDDGGVIELVPYMTADKEALGVVGKIKQLLTQGVKPSEIAILYRENSESQALGDLLSREGIAFHVEAGSDVLKDADVRQLLNLLELAHNPTNELALFRYLHAPFSNVATIDLIMLGRERKTRRISWLELLTSDTLEELQLKSLSHIKRCLQQIEAWYRYVTTHNLGDSVEHVFRASGLLNYMTTQSDHLERLHRMRCFFEEVKHVKTGTPYATLSDLFERLAIRQTYNIPLISSPVAEQGDDAIRLMTAHKSKGLEFSYVFIPHLHDGRWSNTSKPNYLTLPEGIVPHHHTPDGADIEEERRLFYVALTRAKLEVYLSMSELDDKQRKCVVCQFVPELSKVSIAPPTQAEAIPLEGFFSPVQAYFVEETSQNYLKNIVAKQAITPTGLNTYLTCPMEYLYKEVYCIPGVREPFQAFGTAVHKALELWGNWSKTEGHTYSVNSVLSVFAESLLKEGLTEDEVRRYRHLGEDILTAFWEKYASEWIPPLATEYSFTPHNVTLDGMIPITGKIDKIEPIRGSKQVRVIDFKTGRVRSRNEILGQTASSDGDYMRQLVFYTVLAEADPFFPYSVGEVSLWFIDDQKKFTQEVFTISEAQKKDLRELIHSVYGEITQLHFDHTPHKQKFGTDESLCDLLRINTGALASVSTLLPPKSFPTTQAQTTED